jgi:F0F1-type ATP synthase epsilon subunit
MEEERTMHVRITKATHVVWEGDAVSVSSQNTQGPFDVLATHANFITLIKNTPIVVVTADGTTNSYTFDQSVMFVSKNTVRVFADIK